MSFSDSHSPAPAPVTAVHFVAWGRLHRSVTRAEPPAPRAPPPVGEAARWPPTPCASSRLPAAADSVWYDYAAVAARRGRLCSLLLVWPLAAQFAPRSCPSGFTLRGVSVWIERRSDSSLRASGPAIHAQMPAPAPQITVPPMSYSYDDAIVDPTLLPVVQPCRHTAFHGLVLSLASISRTATVFLCPTDASRSLYGSGHAPSLTAAQQHHPQRSDSAAAKLTIRPHSRQSSATLQPCPLPPPLPPSPPPPL